MPPKNLEKLKVSVYTGGKIVSGGRVATVLDTKAGGQNSTLAFSLAVPVGTSAEGFLSLLAAGAESKDIDLADHFNDVITGNKVFYMI